MDSEKVHMDYSEGSFYLDDILSQCHELNKAPQLSTLFHSCIHVRYTNTSGYRYCIHIRGKEVCQSTGDGHVAVQRMDSVF